MLGHRFADPALLGQAVTHASALKRPTNERLEFLGDRVLGLCVGEMLYARFPDLKEGELALKLNRLVRLDACAEIGVRLGIGAYLLVSDGKGAESLRRQPSIVGDALEALIGALFLDGGLEAARAFVRRAWAEHPDFDATRRDAKTMLQEWAQSPSGGRQPNPPAYTLVARDGPAHAPRFRVAAEIPGHPPAEGAASTKQEAEQAAARALLVQLGIFGDEP